ncbi:MAG: hypothetical protein QNL33_16870 [Akkermansiaceae bacterium]|jgi:hypothetical protein
MIDNYSSVANERFRNTDDPDQLILTTFDLSGVGQDTNGRWATLIGTNTIISANHFKPSGSIFFYPDNNASSTAVELGISGDVERIGTTALWLARLDQHAPSRIQPLNYATTVISAPTSPGGPGSNFLFKMSPFS